MGVAKNGNPSAEDILDHIVSVGVCKVADYNAHGTACQKYRISGYNVVGARSNSDLAAAVRAAPVYVEVGVDPYAYQLYSKYSTQPLSASYNRPTIAGVLTGYTVDGDNSYWEMYTRRHGANNNEVRIKLDRFALPFGSISTAAITMETNDLTYQNSTYVVEYVHTKEDLANVPYYVTQLHILDNSLNDITLLDLSVYAQLETLVVGNNALNSVTRLLQPERLGSITIGQNSLSKMTSRRLQGVPRQSESTLRQSESTLRQSQPTSRHLRSEEDEEDAVMAAAAALATAAKPTDAPAVKPNTFIMRNQGWIRELSFNEGSLNGVTEFVMSSRAVERDSSKIAPRSAPSPSRRGHCSPSWCSVWRVWTFPLPHTQISPSSPRLSSETTRSPASREKPRSSSWRVHASLSSHSQICPSSKPSSSAPTASSSTHAGSSTT